MLLDVEQVVSLCFASKPLWRVAPDSFIAQSRERTILLALTDIMRLIGHLPNETSATTFSDYLYVEGITNEVEAEKEGWAVWIHSEDEWTKAIELLSAFL